MPLQKRSIPVGLKIALGVIYGLLWFFVPEGTITVPVATLIVAVSCLVGGSSAWLDYVHGHSSRIVAIFSGWACCSVGAAVTLFTAPDYSFLVILLLPVFSIAGAVTNLWLRNRHPVDIKPDQPEKDDNLLFSNPIFLLLTAYDDAQGCFDKPDIYVVSTAPITDAEREVMREKPAKLDLAGMRASLQKERQQRQ